MFRFDHFWFEDDARKDNQIQVFAEAHKKEVRKLFDQELHELWFRIDLIDLLEKTIPPKLNQKDRAQLLNIDPGNWKRIFVKRQYDPKSATVHGWLRKLNLQYPEIPADTIYDSVAVAAATAYVVWDCQTKTMTSFRKLRWDVREVGIEDAAIQYALAGQLLDQWLTLALTAERDSDVFNHPKVERFLAELVDHVSIMFGKSSSKPFFAKAFARLTTMELRDTSSVSELCHRIKRVWNESPIEAHCVICCCSDDY